MAKDSHLVRGTAHPVIMAVLAIVVSFAPPAFAQQGPSPAAAAPGRKVDSPRGTGSGTPDLAASRHPLDPLEPAEIAAAVAAIRKERRLADSVRFVTVTLKEPSKEVVRRFRPGGEFPREAFVILLDKATGRGYEADVDLRTGNAPAVRGAARGRAAADHARGVRRVRGGGPQVAGVPRGDEEAGHRGPRAWS